MQMTLINTHLHESPLHFCHTYIGTFSVHEAKVEKGRTEPNLEYLNDSSHKGRRVFESLDAQSKCYVRSVNHGLELFNG